jgi:GT2 family glycosyltransferase
MAYRPTFSIVMPVYNSAEKWLNQAIASVERQLYPDWELYLADDASTKDHVWPLLQRHAARDPRIKCVRRDRNGHISAASNTRGSSSLKNSKHFRMHRSFTLMKIKSTSAAGVANPF